MPPIKGRMISRMGRMSGPQTGGSYAHVKLNIPKRRPKFNLKDAKNTSKSTQIRDERFLKLRYPPSISRVLPSVKKFRGAKGFVDLTEDTNSVHSEDSEFSWEEKPLGGQILGVKKSTRGLVTSKYFVRPVTEVKFTGMIWDIAFSPNGDILVSCGEGILLCDYDLQVKSKLENIILAGGISFLADGKIVAVCRNTDTVNIYKPSGIFLRSFSAGFSPMAIEATPEDKLVICDPGSKCVRIFDTNGVELETIGPEGKDFKLRWPLYASMVSSDTFLVSDCHSQSVLQFNVEGEKVREMKMNTSGGNKVLRPHGLCVHENNDVFIIDMATDTVEIFSDNDSFIQTLIPQDEGHHLRPKIVRLGGHSQNYMAVGGLVGIVKLYEFVSEEEANPKKTPVKTPVKTPSKRGRVSNKRKLYLKEEPEPLVKEEVILCDDDDDEEDDVEINDPLEELEKKIENELNGHDEEEPPQVIHAVVENHLNADNPFVVEDSDVSEDEEEEEEGDSLMIVEDDKEEETKKDEELEDEKEQEEEEEDEEGDSLMIVEDEKEDESNKEEELEDTNEDEGLLLVEDKNTVLVSEGEETKSQVVTTFGEYSFVMQPSNDSALPQSPPDSTGAEPLIVLDD